MDSITAEMIKVIPSVLWIVLFIVLLVVFRGPLNDFLRKLGSIEAMGVKLVCMRESIEAALCSFGTKLSG